MAIEDSPAPSSNYGTIKNDTTRSRTPIHIHASLESLDIGPHAFRAPPTPREQESMDVDGGKSSPPTLVSPLLRHTSSHYAGEYGHCSSLSIPVVEEKEAAKGGNDAALDKKGGKDTYFCLFLLLLCFADMCVCEEIYAHISLPTFRLYILHCLCIGEFYNVHTMSIWIFICNIQS